MNGSLQMLLFAGVFCLVGPVCGKEPAQALRVHLYDLAQVLPGTLRSGVAEASRIFKAAGIELIWESPAADALEAVATDMGSRRSGEGGRPYLVVRIIRGMPASSLPGALGYALPFAQTGADVSIFFDRIEGLRTPLVVARYVILGDAIAHEIGHVLLRSPEHSAAGLMRARWDATGWKLAASGLLSFDAGEAKRMGDGVLKIMPLAKFAATTP